MSIIPDYGDILRKHGLENQDVGYFFKKELARYLTAETRLLDVGCGRRAFGEEYYRVVKYRVGVDEDAEALAENTLMNERVCSSIENLPDDLGEFDVIVAQWVFEHMRHPDKSIEILARHCKPGGYLIFMTTNIYSPLMAVSKFLPTSWKQSLKKRFLDVEKHDTYPTPYRINSPGKIDRIMAASGFHKVRLHLTQAYTYFAFNKFLLLLKIYLGKLIRPLPFSRMFRTHILGVYQKS